jgi:hypothetical protein
MVMIMMKRFSRNTGYGNQTVQIQESDDMCSENRSYILSYIQAPTS